MTEIIVALDVEDLSEAERLLERLRNEISFFKVGLRLFTAHGPRAVELVRRFKGKIFLDLKLMDIPQTVAHAVQEASRLGVDALSLHLSGGAAMLRAAAQVSPRPKLWGVSVLTSLSSQDLRAVHPGASVGPMVRRLAKLGLQNGIDGVICSGQDVPALRKALGPTACFITPGIRPAGSPTNDQKRLVTPAQAARLGIRYAVIGRPIIRSSDPTAAARDILAQMRAATKRTSPSAAAPSGSALEPRAARAPKPRGQKRRNIPA